MADPQTPESPGPPTVGLDVGRWRKAMGDRFDLNFDQADPAAIDESLRSGVVFRGTNLWVLIFATFIASIGLNVNSTAVIIGAMLISPLMGPIMGLGYGSAIGDFPLARRATLNLGIAAGISLLASALYFALTPLQGQASELLARTTPTLWDVLIALFGGLAGIVGVTRKEKGNVIPGVAIATALMPPLCTAGYGLANLNLSYFLGASYLFSINSVFIAAATFVMVRFMRLPTVTFIDAVTERRARSALGAIVFVTAAPSLWLAVNLVRNEVYSSRAEAFLADAFKPEEGTLVVARHVDRVTNTIRVTVVGNPVHQPPGPLSKPPWAATT